MVAEQNAGLGKKSILKGHAEWRVNTVIGSLHPSNTFTYPSHLPILTYMKLVTSVSNTWKLTYYI